MLHSLYVLLLPAILLQSIEALGLKPFLARGHRGILKRYCQTAQPPKCLQSHLVYQSIANLYTNIVFWSNYNIFSLQLGSESLLCIYTGVSWGDATLAKQVESTRASLTPLKSYCPDTTGGQLRLDPILLRSWIRSNATDADKGRQRLRVWFWANLKSRSTSTTSCRATWKYDEHNPSRRDFWKHSDMWLELLRGLVESHVLPSCLRPFHW